MAGKKRGRGRRGGSGGPGRNPPAAAGGGATQGLGFLDEIQQLLDTPLADLMGTAEERAEAERLSRLAVDVPAMARLRQVVAFVGKGRAATQAGNLKAADALALARRLGPVEHLPEMVQAMEELPEAAHAFRWAVAAHFVARRGTKIVAGPAARDLEVDPLAAWFQATLALLEHGVLDGFQQGWRKSYVELLDGGAGSLIVALAETDGGIPITAVDEGAWGQVADASGYEPDDEAERAHVVRLVRSMVRQLADAGVVEQVGDEVVLSELGSVVAAMVAFASAEGDEDDEDLDLVDTDAQSLLLVCAEEMDLADPGERLRAWCDARPAGEAVGELCEAMLDDDDPDVWDLGFQALAMVDRAVAEPGVRRLRSHPGLRPLATAWLRGRRPAPPPPG